MSRGSHVLLDEHFESEDERFYDELLKVTSHPKLTALAPRWVKDRRPWARQMLIRYLEDGCDQALEHRSLVKGILRAAEEVKDDALMGHLMAAFDRFIRHNLRQFRRWNWRERRYEDTTRRVRVYPRHRDVVTWYDPRTQRYKLTRLRFSLATRRYLQRRVLRYFRRLAFSDPARFRRAALAALARYKDEDFDPPLRVLDTYAFTSMLFGRSEALKRDSRRITVRADHSLGEVRAAPLWPRAWKGSGEALLEALPKMRSLLARRFLAGWLEGEEEGALRGLKIEAIRPMLRSPHPDVQLFAIGLLERGKGLASLPISDWLELLKIENPLALPRITELLKEHVLPERVNLTQCVDLGLSPRRPVAELGAGWAQQKPIESPEALAEAMRLASASVAPVREAALPWLLSRLRDPLLGRPEHLRELIDVRHKDVREAAYAELLARPEAASGPVIWRALAESPYEDARGFLIAHLEERRRFFEEGEQKGGLRWLWASILLAVHRGSRHKHKALRQLGERVAREPEAAAELLPLLAIALRSVRPPERRAALAAVGRAAFRSPALMAAIGEHIPELSFADPPSSKEASA